LQVQQQDISAKPDHPGEPVNPFQQVDTFGAFVQFAFPCLLIRDQGASVQISLRHLNALVGWEDKDVEKTMDPFYDIRDGDKVRLVGGNWNFPMRGRREDDGNV